MTPVARFAMRLVRRHSCQDVVQLLHDYCEGSLDPRLAASIARHFQRCPDCYAFLSTYREIIRRTGELACDQIPSEVQRRVRSALREQLASQPG